MEEFTHLPITKFFPTVFTLIMAILIPDFREFYDEQANAIEDLRVEKKRQR